MSYYRARRSKRRSQAIRQRDDDLRLIGLFAVIVLAISSSIGERLYNQLISTGMLWTIVALALTPAALYLVWRLVRLFRHWRLSRTELEDFDALIDRYGNALGGKAFEYRLKTLFEVLGAKNVRMTWASGDKGTDLIVTKDGRIYSVQAKCWRAWRVPASVVDEALNGMVHHGCNASMVVTTNYFEADAAAYAVSTGTILIDRDELGRLLQQAKLVLRD